MKMRYGFVTNSSSSSFILAFNSRSEIDNLNISELTMNHLKEQSDEVDINDILAEYREYWEDYLQCDLDWEIATTAKIDISDVDNWINTHPEEYKKIYDEIYEEQCEKRVKALENKLEGKELILSICEGDEWSSYDEFKEMKQLCGVMDYH